MIAAIYNDIVIDHFDHPRNPAAVSGNRMPDEPHNTPVVGDGGGLESGVWIEFQLKMDARMVHTAEFRAYGCPHTVALASWLTEQLVGETLDDRYTLNKLEIAAVLDLPTEKMRSILVAEDALRACAAKLNKKED